MAIRCKPARWRWRRRRSRRLWPLRWRRLRRPRRRLGARLLRQRWLRRSRLGARLWPQRPRRWSGLLIWHRPSPTYGKYPTRGLCSFLFRGLCSLLFRGLCFFLFRVRAPACERALLSSHECSAVQFDPIASHAARVRLGAPARVVRNVPIPGGAFTSLKRDTLLGCLPQRLERAGRESLVTLFLGRRRRKRTRIGRWRLGRRVLRRWLRKRIWMRSSGCELLHAPRRGCADGGRRAHASRVTLGVRGNLTFRGTAGHVNRL